MEFLSDRLEHAIDYWGRDSHENTCNDNTWQRSHLQTQLGNQIRAFEVNLFKFDLLSNLALLLISAPLAVERNRIQLRRIDFRSWERVEESSEQQSALKLVIECKLKSEIVSGKVSLIVLKGKVFFWRCKTFGCISALEIYSDFNFHSKFALDRLTHLQFKGIYQKHWIPSELWVYCCKFFIDIREKVFVCRLAGVRLQVIAFRSCTIPRVDKTFLFLS